MSHWTLFTTSVSVQVIKDTTEPTYDETFEYDLDPSKLGSTELEVSVVDRKGIFARSPLMGRAVVSLANPEVITGRAKCSTVLL